ncbi:MAG: cadherin domain-containing protein [Zavarzinella sp.]
MNKTSILIRPLEILEDRSVPAVFSFAGFDFEQDSTPDVQTLLAAGTYSGAIVTNVPTSATGSISNFPDSTTGFTNSLSFGNLVNNTGTVRALNLPNGNNGTANRSGLELSWSGNRGLTNATGDDFVVYESGSNSTTPEGFMVQVRNFSTGTWSSWYHQPADSFAVTNGAEGGFAHAFDLSDMGLGATDIIDRIRIVNLTDEDRMVDSSGAGEVIPEDNDATSTFLPDPGSLAGFTNFGASTLDPDPIYLGVFNALTDLPSPFTFAGFEFYQENTPDISNPLQPGTFNGVTVTNIPSSATGSVGFPDLPATGFTTSLTLGTYLNNTGTSRALNLPAGNNGSTTRSGLELSWSANRGFANNAGDDLVFYESGSLNTPEGFIIQAFNSSTQSWSPWYYEPADAFSNYTTGSDGAFATAIDLSDLGIADGEIISRIRIVNLILSDRTVNSSGIGEILPEDNGATSSNFPDAGPLASFSNYGSSTLDPDPLYVAVLQPLSETLVDVSVTNTNNQVAVAVGQEITYTIVVSNAGPAAANNVTLTDTFPTNLTGVSYTSVASGGASGNTAAGSGNLNETLNLPLGASVTYTVTGTATTNTPNPLVNTATVTVDPGNTDSNLTNNTATDSDPFVVAPVINNQSFFLENNPENGRIIGTVVATDADVGDTLTYAITAGNGDNIFAINANTGELSISDNTLFELTPAGYQLTVQVTDSFNLTDDAVISVLPPALQHGITELEIDLSSISPSGGTYTVEIVDPVFTLQQELGLTNPVVQGAFNFRGYQEQYFISTNGSNAAGQGYYVLMPDNKLYAYADPFVGPLTLANTLASTPVADFSAAPYSTGNTLDVYQTPTLLSDNDGTPKVVQETALNRISKQYGLTNPPHSFNFAGAKEYYFTSSNDSNPNHFNYFVLLPNNTLVRFNGVSATTSDLVVDFTAEGLGNVYDNPAILHNPPALVDAVTASITGDLLTIDAVPEFDRTVQVKVTKTDGNTTTESTFDFSVINTVPMIGTLNDIVIDHDDDTVDFNLNLTDPDPDGSFRRIFVQSEGYNPLFDLKNEIGITEPPYATNFSGQGERWFESTNNSNSANDSLYVLTSDNKLFAWDGNTFATTIGGSAIADFNTALYDNTAVYNNPALLFAAEPPAKPAVFLNRGPLYDVKIDLGFTNPPYTFNFAGMQEFWFESTNGSNHLGNHLFALLPDGKLYAFDGFSLATSMNRTPVYDLADTGAYQNPASIANSRPSFINDPVFEIKDKYGITKADFAFDFRGEGEKYFISTNGSNAANGGFYVLMPNGDFKAWNGVDLPTSPVVATVPVDVYNDPALLYAATGQKAVLSVDSNTNTGDVELDPTVEFAGTIRVTTTLTDRAGSDTESFLLTVNNQLPVLSAISTFIGTSAAGSGNVNLVASDADVGDVVGFAAMISPYSPLYEIKRTYGLTNPAYAFNFFGFGSFYFQSTNGSNPSGNGIYLLTSDNKLFAWDGVGHATTIAQQPVADFADPEYLGTNVYANPNLINNATKPTVTPEIGTTIVGNTLTLDWDTSFVGTFLTTVYASDGSSTVLQRFVGVVS